MQLSDFDYELSAELIAQEPLTDRSASRMLVVDRARKNICDNRFADLPDTLRPGDLLVLNNTKVFRARLLGSTDTGAKVEIFLIREIDKGKWEALAKPARRLRPGKNVSFGSLLSAQIKEQINGGKVVVVFDNYRDFDEKLQIVGSTPLPPYIKREKVTDDLDRVRYQTIFASEQGAIAAPTAGLHFTPEILNAVKIRGIDVCEITLHVGYGTFEPVRSADLSQHSVLAENYEITNEAADALNSARSEGRRIIAVGTTSTRTLENAISIHGSFIAERSSAALTITPGYQFKAVSGLLTNFHLPQSSLLILTSSFGGHELIMKAYRHAVESRYRFYSYGDCMLII